MEAQLGRRSDRISIELPIQVAGTDCMGEGFMELTHTLVLDRHGAMIRLLRKLVPDQEMNIRCLTTGKESDVRVVGRTGGGPEGYHYGVEILDFDVNLWDIEFPPLVESEMAVARVLLECVRCNARELAYLNEFEAEVLEANQLLSRHCKRCTDSSLWRETHLRAGEEMPPEVQPAAPPPKRTRNDRKHVRLDLKVDLCIRDPENGEELMVTENISRGGFRFKSCKDYAVGQVIEAALPYSRGAANIFTAAKIVHAEELPAERARLYGVAYLPMDKAWPRR